MPLTAIAIKNAKPAAKAYKLSDSEGLYLLVKPTGRKCWRMDYYFRQKNKTLTFGMWPAVSLADARAKRSDAKRLLAEERDPSEERKLEQLRGLLASENTFRAIAEEWVSKKEKDGLAEITLEKIKWLLKLAYPTVGHRPITQIGAQELLLVLRKIEATGRHESARRMRSVMSRVFRYGIATARAERDIAADLRGALVVPRTTHLAAITTPVEAGALLRAIEGYTGHAVTHLALRLSAHLFVRPGELRKAEWAEFDFDKSVWSIPADKMKMRRPHRVPLSKQTLALIEELDAVTGEGRFLFPSFRTRSRPMSENAVNGALRRLGYGQEEMTAHGFRAMAATLLNEMGIWNPDAIERQLAHMEQNGVRRAYSRGEYWDERVRMMQHWSDYLDQLRGGARVVTPRFGAKKAIAASR